MKLSESLQIIEKSLDHSGIKVLSTGDMRRLGHEEHYPQLPEGKWVIANIGVAIPFTGEIFD